MSGNGAQSRQTVENLRGEIEFRRKLARQHTTGDLLLPDYFGKDDHDKIMAERIATTREAFQKLARAGVDFSRFVELGAERGHRSLVLASEFGADGIAMDISLDQLRTAAHFADVFGMKRLPMRVCCDANNLPLKSGAAPFVFCYQFLHHFPRLDEVMGEIRRVLAGTFFFDEEPMGRLLQLHLYKQSSKEYSKFNLRKGKLIRWFESFISEPASDEIEHGIIENHGMPMRHWRDNLLRFDAFDVRVRTLRHIKSRVTAKPRVANLPGFLLGGVIHGTAQQYAASSPALTPTPADWLRCPACSRDDASLIKQNASLTCTKCDNLYPVIDDIPVLIEPVLRNSLYPQYD